MKCSFRPRTLHRSWPKQKFMISQRFPFKRLVQIRYGICTCPRIKNGTGSYQSKTASSPTIRHTIHKKYYEHMHFSNKGVTAFLTHIDIMRVSRVVKNLTKNLHTTMDLYILKQYGLNMYGLFRIIFNASIAYW